MYLPPYPHGLRCNIGINIHRCMEATTNTLQQNTFSFRKGTKTIRYDAERHAIKIFKNILSHLSLIRLFTLEALTPQVKTACKQSKKAETQSHSYTYTHYCGCAWASSPVSTGLVGEDRNFRTYFG